VGNLVPHFQHIVTVREGDEPMSAPGRAREGDSYVRLG